MMFYVYIFLTFALTCMGSICGMGGAVVLKPVMDLAGDYPAAEIGVLTATSVFFMALVSVFRNLGGQGQFRLAGALALGFGAVAGGYVGQALLDHLIASAAGDPFVKLCQNITLAFVECSVLAYAFAKNRKKLELSHGVFYWGAGFLLGMVSAFLGIGGGAFNVAALMFLFNMDIKKAAIHSLLIILFSQAAKLASIAINEGFAAFNLMPLLPCMAIAAIAGSLLGTVSGKRMSPMAVLVVFGVMLTMVLCATGYNIVKFAR